MEMSVKLISSLMRLFIRGCLREQEELASEQDIPDQQAYDGNEREEDSYRWHEKSCCEYVCHNSYIRGYFPEDIAP